MYATLFIALLCCTPADPPQAEWRVAATPAVSIGTASGAQEYEFNFIGGAVRLGDGRIAVSDGGSNELRFYDANGRFIRAVGRTGEGPGEFRRIGRVWRHAGDTLIVYDNRTHRLSVMDANGRFIRSGNVSGAVAGKFVSPIALLGDGTWLSESTTTPAMGTYDRAFRDSVTLLRVRLDGTVVHTYGTFPGTENFIRAQGGGASVLPRVFGRQTHAVTAGNHVFIGTQDAYRITVFEGNTRRAEIRQDIRPRAVSRADAARMRRDFVAEGQSDGAREFLQGVLDAMPMPTTMPAYGRLLTDTEGLLWVEDYRMPSEQPSRWRVYRANGQFAATVALPHDLQITEIGRDYVLGVSRSGMGVERVQLYRLQRG